MEDEWRTPFILHHPPPGTFPADSCAGTRMALRRCARLVASARTRVLAPPRAAVPHGPNSRSFSRAAGSGFRPFGCAQGRLCGLPLRLVPSLTPAKQLKLSKIEYSTLFPLRAQRVAFHTRETRAGTIHGKPGFRLATRTPPYRLKNYMGKRVWEEDSVKRASS